ncbi:MAG: MarR family transcriptional regulator [Ectothiorhodospiraceae bacterium]|jgi:predicted transcriptional regulator|nr:MarR family transcriptional regulator [Ectothiorhodospiraceae bacterium]
MRAIIDIAKAGHIAEAAKADLAAGGNSDYVLSFESARSLFSEITPSRLDLLDVLARVGPCSIYALAKEAQRNYSNVHGDANRLIDLGLIERTEDDLVFVPFDAIEIRMSLAHAA